MATRPHLPSVHAQCLQNAFALFVMMLALYALVTPHEPIVYAVKLAGVVSAAYTALWYGAIVVGRLLR